MLLPVQNSEERWTLMSTERVVDSENWKIRLCVLFLNRVGNNLCCMHGSTLKEQHSACKLFYWRGREHEHCGSRPTQERS
jgi:hypothetical protein